MSKIQKLPQEILEDIAPHLRPGEAVGKALFQDSQLPTKVWLVETDQSIVFYGQEPDKNPVVMVCLADEIKEIDYLQKEDYIHVVFYYSKNDGKAGFKFKREDAKEIDEFLMDFSDLITARYRDENGKIHVLQRALPIGHKDRKVFSKKATNPPKFASSGLEVSQPPKAAPKPDVLQSSKPVPPKSDVLQTSKPVAPKSDVLQPSKPVPPKSDVLQSSKPVAPKPDVLQTSKSVAPKPDVLQTSKSVAPKPEVSEPSKPTSTSPDYGNPVYFIGATIIATIVGFFCLSFFKYISRFTYLSRKN